MCLCVFRDEPLQLGQQQLPLRQQRAGVGHGAGLSVGGAPAHKLGQCGQTCPRIHCQGGKLNRLYQSLPADVRPDLLMRNKTGGILQCAGRFEELKLAGGFPRVDNQRNALTEGKASSSDGLSALLDTGETGSNVPGQLAPYSAAQLPLYSIITLRTH